MDFTQDPLPRLQGNPLWAHWENALDLMGDLILVGKFRSWILNLPDFPLDSLHALPGESRRAYVLFAFLSHGFIRGAAAATEEEQKEPNHHTH